VRSDSHSHLGLRPGPTVRSVSVFGPVVQIAYVVPDPAAAALHWGRTHGAGPFFLREHIPVTDVVHRGRASSFDHTSAYGWAGEVMVELFVQHDDAPTAVRERFAFGATGLHHVACFVPDLDAALERAPELGMSVATEARAGGTRFAFVDDVAACGHYWELYEPSDRLLGFYGMVRDAHRGWDGSEPVRIIG
jgi:hypothetical protein